MHFVAQKSQGIHVLDKRIFKVIDRLNITSSVALKRETVTAFKSALENETTIFQNYKKQLQE